jgi:hypothetical protein
MKGKSAIGWFLPYCERGIKLRNITMTTGILNLLNYKPEQFSIDLVNLGAHAFEYLLCNLASSMGLSIKPVSSPF